MRPESYRNRPPASSSSHELRPASPPLPDGADFGQDGGGGRHRRQRGRPGDFRRATRTYGWAIAQMITLLSPEVVVVGGGVPLAGEDLFFAPLRQEIDRYVFPPLRGTYRIVPAELGEAVVVHGALVLARAQAENGNIAALFIPQSIV